MFRHNTIRNLGALVAAGLATTSLVGLTPNPAQAAAPSRYEVNDTQTISDYCGFAGLNVRRTIHIDVIDGVRTSAGTAFLFHWNFTSVRENLANGKTLTTIGVNVGGDHRVVDDGNGMYTVYSDVTDSDRAYSTDGEMVGVTAVHGEWAAVYDSNTDTWSDPLYVHDTGHDSAGDYCAPGGLVEQYLI